MTNNEASFMLANIDRRIFDDDDELNEALDMAIKALEVQEGDCYLKCEFASPCLYCKHEFEEKGTTQTVEEATADIAVKLEEGYFKTSREGILDLEEHTMIEEYADICKQIAEKYPEKKEPHRKGLADYLADDPSLLTKVGAEELGLADDSEADKLIEGMMQYDLEFLNGEREGISASEMMKMGDAIAEGFREGLNGGADVRENRTSDIVEFPTETSYKYFAKEILEQLWDRESEAARIEVVDKDGKVHEIIGRHADNGVVKLFI